MTQQDVEKCKDISVENGKWRQHMAAISINLSSLTGGIMIGWLSPTIPQLLNENPPIGTEPLTEDEVSWLSSVMNITPFLALPLCAWSSERFGRKVTGCGIAVPAIVSWLLILIAQNFYYLLIARLLVGLVLGLTSNLNPVYVAEISSKTVRGQIGCYLSLINNIGILCGFVLGAALSYHLFAICGLILPIVFFSTFIFMPETPVYLVRKGRINEATRSLMWLRDNDKATVNRELFHLQQQLAEIADCKESVGLKDLFRNRGTIKGFIISVCLLTGQPLSGHGTMLTYTAMIFEHANSSLSSNNAAMILAVIQVIGISLSTFIIERAGRKPLLLMSCGAMMSCHLIFGMFFLLQNQAYDVSSFSWVPITALSFYALAYSMGLGPAAYVVAAEVFSPDIASLVNLLSLSSGMMDGWSSPTIPQLLNDNSPIGTEPLTEDEISWLSSATRITPLLAVLFSAWSCERFGRKITGCCTAVPATISWLLILFAQNFYYLLIARLLCGVTFGLIYSVIPLYVSEISATTIRGQFGCCFGFSINLGILCGFVLGAALSYHLFAIFALIIPVVFFVTFIFMPETPTYLIRKGRIEEGTRSLMWLKSNNKSIVDCEVLHLQKQLTEISDCKNSANFKDLFRNRGTIKGFIISLCLITGQATSGYGIIFTYTARIFELADTTLSPNNAAIVLAVIELIGSVLSTLIIERTGRRSLLLISCAGMITSHFIFGVFFFLQRQTYDLSPFSWLPIAVLSLYALAYAIGLGPVAYIVASEVFSPDIASLGISVCLVPTYISSFIGIKFFPMVANKFGNFTPFLILSSFCLCTFMITYVLLPETKGRSVESIFEELNSKPKKTSVIVHKIDR